MDKKFKCNPKCSFFSSPENPSWKWSEDRNYKISTNSLNFICRYDGHVIKSWYDNCPKEEENYKYN